MESISFWGTSARALLLGAALLLPGLTLAQGSTDTSTKAAGPQEDGFRMRLQTAAWLYEELEFEKALKALSQARALVKTDDERTQVALYEGVVLADLGQRARSLMAFREALTLTLEARLPVKVSPKVEQDFEDVRKEVQSERAVQALAKAPPSRPLPTAETPVTNDRPVQPSGPTSDSSSSPVPTVPMVVPNPPQLREERSRGLRPLPLVLLGTGVVAGGVGGYFGLQSRGKIQDAREPIPMEARISRLEEAQGQALVANILFGAAITAAAGAAISWFTSNETESVAEVSP